MPNKIQVQPYFFNASPIKQANNIIKIYNITPVKTTPNKLESRYHSNSLLRKQWSSQDTNILQKNRMTPLKELAKSINASPKQIYDKIRALKKKGEMCLSINFLYIPTKLLYKKKYLKIISLLINS